MFGQNIFGVFDIAFASRLAPTGEIQSKVGASLLAKNDNAVQLKQPAPGKHD